MAKIPLNNVASGYNRSKINQNFVDLESELQDKVFYRNNPDGEPNQMENDMDMNSNDIANTKDIYTDRIRINGKWVTGQEETSARDADTVTYDNTTSGLAATETQAAIDEVEGRIDTAEADIVTVEGRLDNVGAETLDTSSGTDQAMSAALDDRIVKRQTFSLARSSLASSRLSDGDGLVITSGGRAGVFAWRSGDKSASVSADEVTTNEGDGGHWFALDKDKTGATGAFERLDLDPGYVYPRHYGATENTDQTALLQKLILQYQYSKSVMLDGKYEISGGAGVSALKIHEGCGLVAPKFNYFVAGSNQNSLYYRGTGDALEVVHTDGTSSPQGFVVENVVVFDADGTGRTGLVADKLVAGRISGASNGFDNALKCSTWFYYTRMDWLGVNFRTMGAAFGGNINSGGLLKLQLSSSITTVTKGFSVGDSSIFPATQSTSNSPQIDVSVEISSGTPFDINLMRAPLLNLYFETPGDFADYNSTTVVLNNIEGGHINLGVTTEQTRGFIIDNSRDVNITGYIEGAVSESGRVGAGCVGINVAGLAAANVSAFGDFVTGYAAGGAVGSNEIIRVGYGRVGQRPGVGTWPRGSRLEYHNISVASNKVNTGAIVLTSGTEGSVSQLASGVSGEKLIAVADRSAFSQGDIVQITNVTGTYVVNGFEGANNLVIDTALPSTFTDETITYVAPTYVEQWTATTSTA